MKCGTREEMLARMSPEEFQSWAAYHELSPIGTYREDLRAGLLWSLLATVNSDSKKHPHGIALEKYPMFEFERRMTRPQPKVTSQSLYRVLKAFADASSKKPS